MIHGTRTRRFVCVFLATNGTTRHFDLFQGRILREGKLTGGTGTLTGHISERERKRKAPTREIREKATGSVASKGN